MSGRLVEVAAPSALPLSDAEIREHLRVDLVAPVDGDLITLIAQAAVSHIDGRDGWLGRALMEQTWNLMLDAFPPVICIPLPPLQSIAEIVYVDGDGVEQTLAAEDYTIVDGGFGVSRVVPAYGVSWPSTRSVDDAVRVEFVAGYADAAGVPAAIKSALLLAIGHLYQNRESVVIAANAIRLPESVDYLLAPYRIWTH